MGNAGPIPTQQPHTGRGKETFQKAARATVHRLGGEEKRGKSRIWCFEAVKSKGYRGGGNGAAKLAKKEKKANKRHAGLCRRTEERKNKERRGSQGVQRKKPTGKGQSRAGQIAGYS